MLLESLAWLTEGSIIEDGGAPALRFTRPSAWVASLTLLSGLAYLLSPVGRRWASLALLLRRRQLRREDQNRPEGGLDVAALVSEWGINPGPPRSGRQAGVPGGERIYQSGDTLRAARPSTLAPFTAAAKSLHLPPRLPVVRLRHLGAAIEATVLVDCSPALNVPSWSSTGQTKSELAGALVQLIAGFIWSRGGSVRLGPLDAPAALSDTFGPGSEAELARAVQDLRDRGWIAREPDAEPGEINTVCFVLVDLAGEDERHTGAVVSRLAQEGCSVRLACLSDPDEEELTGLCYDVSGLVLHDRSEWTAEDLHTAYERRAATYQSLIEHNDGRFVQLTTDLNTAGVVDRLGDTDFLA
jgi:hypothetical protein